MELKNVNSLCNVEMGKKLLSPDINEIQYLNKVELPTDVIRKIFR